MSAKSGTKKFDKIVDLNHYKLQNPEIKERPDDLDKEVIKEIKRQAKKIIDG